MQLTFRMEENSQAITLEELNAFETQVGHPLPQDYRQHMLTHNGGEVEEDVDHINYSDGSGISYFYPIKYGFTTMEEVLEILDGVLPSGFILIGTTTSQGKIIMSINNDNTYGNIKEWFPDGDMQDLSPSFTQLLNDMVGSEE